ncbi:hypothetical protein SmJEL517_g05183 [Synchytrium microbalum]|uniref:DH domain-containing protein n=1 Tax=Synchytrium microbalum TaxID=1806994 RepID=A0A507BQI0_9FUNG|nr:uncharacterized protein SmJEL517_g05183 [Synchytrium microbalum]TPX31477.1 hypothetical protein SmJEL517_g05183 [Synchytrium microbalum]
MASLRQDDNFAASPYIAANEPYNAAVAEDYDDRPPRTTTNQNQHSPNYDIAAGRRPITKYTTQPSSTVSPSIDRTVSLAGSGTTTSSRSSLTRTTTNSTTGAAASSVIPPRTSASMGGAANPSQEKWQAVTEENLDTEKTYTVKTAFSKTSDDEVNLKVADKVTISISMGGNMVWGTNQVTGAEGLFPVSCLVYIPERPLPAKFPIFESPTRSLPTSTISSFTNQSPIAPTAPIIQPSSNSYSSNSYSRPASVNYTNSRSGSSSNSPTTPTGASNGNASTSTPQSNEFKAGRYVAIRSYNPPPGNDLEVPLTIGDEVEISEVFDEELAIGLHLRMQMQGCFKRSCLKRLDAQIPINPIPIKVSSHRPTLAQIVQSAVEMGTVQDFDVNAFSNTTTVPTRVQSARREAVPTLTDVIIPDVARTYEQWRAAMEAQKGNGGGNLNDMNYLNLLEGMTQNMAHRNQGNREEQEAELRRMINPPMRTASAMVPKRQLSASLANHPFPQAHIPPRTFPVTASGSIPQPHGLIISDDEAVDRVILQSRQEQQKEQEKAVMIVNELIETEKNYRDGLKVLNDRIVGTMIAVAGTQNEILSREELDRYFRNVPDLLQLTTEICEKLDAARETHPEDPVSVANVFLQYTPEMSALYPLYAKSFAMIRNLFDELRVRGGARGELFREFLAAYENQKIWQRQDFLHFIVLPIRRIPSMWLIFERLVGKCDPHHPSYRCIPATEDYLYELGAVLNKVQKDEAAALAMATMAKQVDNLPSQASDSTIHRFVSTYDALDTTAKRAPKNLRLFLLSDALIVCSVNPLRRGKEHDIEKKYTFLYSLDVKKIMLDESVDEQDIVRLVPTVPPTASSTRTSGAASRWSASSTSVAPPNPDGSLSLVSLSEALTLKVLVNMQQPGAPRDFAKDLQELWSGATSSGPNMLY